jgi:CheY-like chemotaxis protein
VKKRVLIVEDDEGRCKWFRHRLGGGYELDVTCSVPEAIGWLGAREYTLIMLDHDLREEHYFSDEPDDERTGYGVAAWLAENPQTQPTVSVVIHSLNYEGARRMLDKLLGAGFDAEHVPFPYLQSGLRF